jgi:hypothetical protein
LSVLLSFCRGDSTGHPPTQVVHFTVWTPFVSELTPSSWRSARCLPLAFVVSCVGGSGFVRGADIAALLVALASLSRCAPGRGQDSIRRIGNVSFISFFASMCGMGCGPSLGVTPSGAESTLAVVVECWQCSLDVAAGAEALWSGAVARTGLSNSRAAAGISVSSVVSDWGFPEATDGVILFLVSCVPVPCTTSFRVGVLDPSGFALSARLLLPLFSVLLGFSPSFLFSSVAPQDVLLGSFACVALGSSNPPAASFSWVTRPALCNPTKNPDRHSSSCRTPPPTRRWTAR